MAEAATDQALRRLMDGSAWNEFCDALKAAGALVVGPGAPESPLERAEGFRYLARLTRAGLESFFEASDAEAPEFKSPVGPTIKMGMDNPDNVYMSAPVKGSFDYRITGKRGSVHYLGFGSQAGNYGSTGSLPTTGYLEAKDMQIAPDGCFEIIASSRPHPGNWLPMSADTRMIQIRQTRLDHARETLAEVRIERLGGPSRPRPMDPARVDRQLQGAARFVHGTARLFASWANDFEKHVNQLPRFDPDRAALAGGDPNIAYYHSYWRLAPDEVLLVSATPPECDYWNFQLANHWLESLDYRWSRIHVNKHTAVHEPDGSVRVAIAHRDPGLPNWLDTCGHAQGTMCLRWVRAKEHPEPRTRVVRLAELGRG